MQHVNLVIATPGYSMMGNYVRSLLSTIAYCSSKGISTVWLNDYSSHVGDAREVTLSATRDNNIADSRPLQGALSYDKILWIDSDIEWTPEDALKLYESEHDIVTGAYLLATGEATVYPVESKRGFDYSELKDRTDTIQVKSAGFGFICVKKGVFEKMSRPWFQSWPTSIKTDDGKEYSFNIMGEDISWCTRARELGFEIWADLSVKVNHHKNFKLTWEGPKAWH